MAHEQRFTSDEQEEAESLLQSVQDQTDATETVHDGPGAEASRHYLDSGTLKAVVYRGRFGDIRKVTTEGIDH